MRCGFFYSPKYNKIFVGLNVAFSEKDYRKSYMPKSEVIIEEITRETTTPSALNFETLTISYKRTNAKTPILIVVLQQASNTRAQTTIY